MVRGIKVSGKMASVLKIGRNIGVFNVQFTFTQLLR